RGAGRNAVAERGDLRCHAMDPVQRLLERDLSGLEAAEQAALVAAAHGRAALVHAAAAPVEVRAGEPEGVVILIRGQRQPEALGQRELVLLERGNVEEDAGAAEAARGAEVRAVRTRGHG